MTTELIKLLSDFFTLIRDWSNKLIPTEEEFLAEARPLVEKIIEELKNQELPEVKE